MIMLKLHCILILRTVAGGFIMKNVSRKTLDLVQLSLFSAIIILMALVPSLGYIPIPPGMLRATIIHIPVIIGSIVLGPKKGAILGTLFGITSLLTNTVSPTPVSFVFSPFLNIGDWGAFFASFVICFVPRIFVGIVPYYVYKLIHKKTKKNTVPLIVSGICGSLTNTILVTNLIYFLFGQQYVSAKGIASYSLYYTIVISALAVNGVIEGIIASVLTLGISKPLLTIKK